jgi:hypothetical protein
VDNLRTTATQLDAAAETIADSGAAVTRAGLSTTDFGADAPGWLGELGRAMHGRWTTALDDRHDEAVEAAARLAELAASVRTASSGYADTDQAVRRRHPEES